MPEALGGRTRNRMNTKELRHPPPLGNPLSWGRGGENYLSEGKDSENLGDAPNLAASYNCP